MRDRSTFIAIGFILGLGLSLIFLVLSVPQFRDPTYRENSHQQQISEIDIQNENIDNFWERFTKPRDTYAQWTMALFAIIGTGVSIWAVWLVRDTLEVNRAATQAALRSSEIAERTLFDIERPHLFVDNVVPIQPVEDEWFNIPEDAIPFFRLQFDTINFGRTPAIVDDIKTGILLGTLPTEPRYFPGEIHKSEWVIPANGGSRRGEAFIRTKITHSMLNEMWLSQTYIEDREPVHLWFYGSITYESIHGIVDEIGFIYRYLPHGKSFHLENIPSYTFRRHGKDQSELT